MGSFFSKAMDDNMQKQQDFMLKTQRIQMERQIQMQNQMRERQMAMQIARSRDLFTWWASFYTVAGTGLLMGFLRSRRPAMLGPLVPLSFIVGYLYDAAYYTKIERIRAEADRILDNETILLEMPHGLPNYDSIEKGRLHQKDQERLNQGHDIFL